MFNSSYCMATITKPYQTRKPQNKNHPAPLTTSPEESATPNGDEIWETLLAMPESEELILQMERELENKKRLKNLASQEKRTNS